MEASPEVLEKMVDISSDCYKIQMINPIEVYHYKNTIIMNSKEFSDDEKLKRLDQNQDKYIEDCKKSSGIIGWIRRNKLSSVCIFAIITKMAYDYFANKDVPEIIDTMVDNDDFGQLQNYQ